MISVKNPYMEDFSHANLCVAQIRRLCQCMRDQCEKTINGSFFTRKFEPAAQSLRCMAKGMRISVKNKIRVYKIINKLYSKCK